MTHKGSEQNDVYERSLAPCVTRPIFCFEELVIRHHKGNEHLKRKGMNTHIDVGVEELVCGPTRYLCICMIVRVHAPAFVCARMFA